MAVYNKAQGMRSILNAALGEYQSKGFRLLESGDRFLRLYRRDELVSVIFPRDATIPAIHRACQNHLGLLRAV